MPSAAAAPEAEAEAEALAEEAKGFAEVEVTAGLVALVVGAREVEDYR